MSFAASATVIGVPMVGLAGTSGNANGAETPLSPGFRTVTCAVPACVMSDAGMSACRLEALRRVVVRPWPFHWTVAPTAKFDPLTVSVNAAPAAVAVLGDVLVMRGGASRTRNATAAELPPPGAGCTTVIMGELELTTSLAGIAAWSFVALTNVVVRELPFQRTTACGVNRLPTTVNVKPLPVNVDSGASAPITGTGYSTENVSGAERPPPGGGLATLTSTKPGVCSKYAGTFAVNTPGDSSLESSPQPPNHTQDAATKPVPVSRSLNESPGAAR